MSVALIHDRQLIQNFWEKQIDRYQQNASGEERRINGSALHKLRSEWLVRLEKRNKHLKSLKENCGVKTITDSMST
ncbi:protein FAM240C-like [Corythoichthys intestinalis]|uniref:protein FAM240C-like n=1 Tax=Corythoichthys intestinalis TaxID=161448 RepID=UPI0025A54926|nr:protein FAM240C-like [Corythoichthys intestinalis]